MKPWTPWAIRPKRGIYMKDTEDEFPRQSGDVAHT